MDSAACAACSVNFDVVSSVTPKAKRGRKRKRSQDEPPNMSEVRIVLLGKNVEESSRVGNFILGRAVFETEAPPPSVEQHSERVGGRVEGRYITLINTPHLFDAQISQEELTKRVKECLSLSAPGPHALLLVLQSDSFTKQDQDRITSILDSYGPCSMKHVIFLISRCGQCTTRRNQGEQNKLLQQFITESKGRSLEISTFTRPQLLENIDELVMENGTHLTYEAQQGAVKREDTLRIILLGKTGVGKSATGNTILGKEVFPELLSSRSVTSVCQKETAEVQGKQITVIDTPGLFDTDIPNVEMQKEIVKCITMAAPGPHVFLLVLTVGRFTQEEREAVKMIQDIFGEQSRSYTMVLFTRGDNLKKMSIDEFIKDSENLQTIIHQCGNRYHVFNNNESGERNQVTALMQKINSMVEKNGGSCYTNKMFQQLQKALLEQQERILQERQEEIEKETNELTTKFEDKIEEIKKTMEQKRNNLKIQRSKKEAKFKIREDKIKEETNEKLKEDMDKKLRDQQEAFNKKITQKEEDLKEQMQRDLENQKQYYEMEKERIRRQAQDEAREKAENGFCTDLDKVVLRARAKRRKEGAEVWWREKLASFQTYIKDTAGGIFGVFKNWIGL